jgi:pre-mRNA-splicing factor CWC22
MELCQVILDTSSEKSTYERFFGLIGYHICLSKKTCIECFEKLFEDQYQIVHRHENFKLKNIATFFAHLLETDSISWRV